MQLILETLKEERKVEARRRRSLSWHPAYRFLDHDVVEVGNGGLRQDPLLPKFFVRLFVACARNFGLLASEVRNIFSVT